MVNFVKKYYLIILPVVFIVLIAQVDKYDQLTTDHIYLLAVSYTHLTLPTKQAV